MEKKLLVIPSLCYPSVNVQYGWGSIHGEGTDFRRKMNFPYALAIAVGTTAASMGYLL